MKDNSRVHFGYVVAFLILIIIIIGTIRLGDDANLVQYMSFALTLTSLVLALLAIVYAFFSNNQFSSNINALSGVTEEVKKASKGLSNLSDNITESINRIPKHLEDVKKETQVASEAILQMKKGESINEEDDGTNKNLSDIQLDSYLKTGSFWGLITLYAVNKYFEKKEWFEIKKFIDNNENREYAYGYFISSSAIGIFEYSVKENKFFIDRMNDYVAAQIDKVLQDTIDGYTTDDDGTNQYKKIFDEVNNKL
ncbi:hypothetical protein [Carboxylicivirga marina]|uniref:hypothetical protein n=1 Tax=Carboxylicivirga marina TaxID=2800988 RepID=UPI002591E10A|nr:hypothetical protein [uncultured Carboxylicivirga sp.]